MLESDSVLNLPLLFHFTMHITIEIFSSKFTLSTLIQVYLIIYFP